MVIIKKHWYAVVATISILFEGGQAKGSEENVGKISRHFDGDVFSLKGELLENQFSVKEKIMIRLKILKHCP